VLLVTRGSIGAAIIIILVAVVPITLLLWAARRPVTGDDNRSRNRPLASNTPEGKGEQVGPEGSIIHTVEPGDNLELSEISPLPDTGSSFVGREEFLRQLDGAWYGPNEDGTDINIVSLVAAGGVGKSALINEWLSRLGEHKGGADKVFIWSFADQGVTERVVSADSFFEEALKFFGEMNPYLGTQVGKGQRLAACIQDRQKHKKPLLILDGLEPFQHPPGDESGKLKNDSLKTLLVGLAELNPGLCVISTRLAIADLRRFEGHSHRCIDLQNLSDQAGAELLKSRGIKGSQQERESASRYYGGHALALTLLASYLDLFGGDVHQRENVSLLAEDEEHGRRWRAVMQAYESWFEDEETEELGWACLAVWRLFGLFERPVDETFLREEFLGSEPIPGLTDGMEDLHLDERLDVWRRIIRRLSGADLLSVNRTLGKPEGIRELDVHALIREYFSEQLESSSSEAWREGNERLADLYVKRYRDTTDESPTINDMKPLFQAVVHACKADRHHEALHQIYLPHIMREDEAYAESKLGALGDLISVLSRFFRAGEWGKPVPNLSESDQLLVLIDAGRYLTQTRGYAAPEVGACYKTAKTLSDEKGDPRRFFEARLGRSRFLRVGGQLTETDTENQQMLEAYENLNQRTQDILRPTVYSAVQRALATNYFYMGDFVKANDYASEGAANLKQVSVPMGPKERKEAFKRARLDVNEPSILCLSYQAAALWLLGEPEKALRTSADAVNRAADLDHAHTLAIALLLDGMVKQFSGDTVLTKECAERLIKLCNTYGFPLWRISGEILEAWAAARTEPGEQEDFDKAIANGIRSWEQDFTAKLFSPYWHALLAETRLMKGNIKKGLESVEEGLRCSNEEHWWEAELFRLKGELMLRQPQQDPTGATECFEQALHKARSQKAKSLQLRAAASLASIGKLSDGKENAPR
jgi:hypothetical protein